MPTVVHKIECAVFAPLNKLSASFREFSEQNIQCTVHLHMYLITCSIVIYHLHFVLFKCTGAGWTIILQTFVYEMNISHGLIPPSTKLLC